MSLKNILQTNKNDLFCHDLRVDGDITVAGAIVIDAITLNNLNVNQNFEATYIVGNNTVGRSVAVAAPGNLIIDQAQGTLTVNGNANFGAANTTTFANGSNLIMANAQVNQGLILNAGSNSAVEGNVGFDNAAILQFPAQDFPVVGNYETGGQPIATNPANFNISFVKVGRQVTVKIPSFVYTVPNADPITPGFFEMRTGDLGIFTPEGPNGQRYNWPAFVINDNAPAIGCLTFNKDNNPANRGFTLTYVSPAFPNFTGTNGATQGLQGYDITVSYLAAQ